MKKKSLIILPLLSFLAFTSCGQNEEPGEENKDGHKYSIVTYDYNYEGATDSKFVVNEGANLPAPKDPIRSDYVFEGWYTDEACQSAFDGFDKALTEDITLYAKWSEFASLTDSEKVEYFLNQIKGYEGNTNNAYVKSTVAYAPLFLTEEVYYLYLESDYTRYIDLVTIEDYAYLDEASTEVAPTGVTQLFKEGDTYYELYKSLENDADNYKRSAKEADIDENQFFEIGVSNLELGSLTSLKDLLDNSPDNIYDDPEVYDLSGLNITSFDSSKETSIVFSFRYSTIYSGNDGTLLQELYDVAGNIQILNGKVHRSTISTMTTTAMDGAAYLTVLEENVIEYQTGEFASFTGEKFNPSDFKEAEQ